MVVDGKVQDSDYYGNNRTYEYSRAYNTTNTGDTIDKKLAVGLILVARDLELAPYLEITPLFGAIESKQVLKITNGYQAMPNTGVFPGLDSTYQSKWKGYYAGADIDVWTGTRLILSGKFEVHNARYEANGNWNQRQDLAHPLSFSQQANNARGIVLVLESVYRFAPNLDFTFSYGYQTWKSKPGIDTTYLSDGSTSEKRLNGVNWKSSALNLGFGLRLD